jgi:hypothetical protein
MCDKGLIVGYLYDELTASERGTFDAHLKTCAVCRAEVDELRRTRAHMTTWAPPQPEFGFRIVRGAAAPPQPAPRRWMPAFGAWGLTAAAATLVLAAAAAIANIEVRYDASGLSVRTGWANTATPTVAVADNATVPATPVAATSQPSEQLRADLRVIDQRLRELERSRTGTAEPSKLAAVSARSTDTELLNAVRRIVAESEARQQRELAVRVTQLWRDVEAARATDVVRYQQALQQIRGMTDTQLLNQGQKLDYLMRVSGNPR